MDAYAARLLQEHPEVEEIVVFGSFLRGNYAPGSDLDVVVVLGRSGVRIRDRIPGLLPESFPVGVDLFPYTREEMSRMLSPRLLAEIARSPWRYAR
jgi:predicted nucleotidyltransferase